MVPRLTQAARCSTILSKLLSRSGKDAIVHTFMYPDSLSKMFLVCMSPSLQDNF